MSKDFTSLLKLIIVDDSMIVLERLKQILNDVENIVLAGFASNITTAEQLINEEKPCAVILDIHLPEDAPAKNGMDLIASVRSNHPGMVIIMLTNLAGEQYRNKCMTLGADYFFDKSNDFEKIPETLVEISKTQKCK